MAVHGVMREHGQLGGNVKCHHCRCPRSVTEWVGEQDHITGYDMPTCACACTRIIAGALCAQSAEGKYALQL
jgi:hypothetical protein